MHATVIFCLLRQKYFIFLRLLFTLSKLIHLIRDALRKGLLIWVGPRRWLRSLIHMGYLWVFSTWLFELGVLRVLLLDYVERWPCVVLNCLDFLLLFLGYLFDRAIKMMPSQVHTPLVTFSIFRERDFGSPWFRICIILFHFKFFLFFRFLLIIIILFVFIIFRFVIFILILINLNWCIMALGVCTLKLSIIFLRLRVVGNFLFRGRFG